MPVRTRSQVAASESKKKDDKKADKKAIEPDTDSWDIPQTNLKSSIVKTYSKKQPFRTYWTAGSKKLIPNTKDSNGRASKPGWNNLFLHFVLSFKFALLQMLKQLLMISNQSHFV